MDTSESRSSRTGPPVNRRDVMRGVILAGAAAAGGLAVPGVASAQGAAPLAKPSTPPRAAPAGFFDGWLGTLTDVIDVAGKLLPLVAVARSNGQADPIVQVGGVAFGMMEKPDGTTALCAHNVTDDEVGLSYTLVSSPDVTTTAYQPLPPGAKYVCADDLDTYADGQVYLAKAPESVMPNGTLTRSITSAIRNLSIAVGINIVGGIEVKYTKDARGDFHFSVKSTGPARVFRARVQATSPDGNAVDGMAESTSPTDPSDIEINFPPGVNLAPCLAYVQVFLDVDSESLRAATSERSGRTF